MGNEGGPSRLPQCISPFGQYTGEGPGRKQMALPKAGTKSKFNKGTAYKSEERAKRVLQNMIKHPGPRNSVSGNCKELKL